MPGGLLTKQRTSKCLRRFTQTFHLFMVSLQDWPCMYVMNNHPPSVSFSDRLSPASEKHLTCSWPAQSPVTIVPRFWGLVSQAQTPEPEFPVLIQKETGLQQRWGKGTTGKLDCKSLAELSRTRECCAEVLAAGYLNTVYIVSFCLGLIDSLLTRFGFWLFTLFSKWNPQWMHPWVFFMRTTSLVTS